MIGLGKKQSTKLAKSPLSANKTPHKNSWLLYDSYLLEYLKVFIQDKLS